MNPVIVLEFSFKYICKYSDCYNSTRNNFSILNNNKLCAKKGVYLFYDKDTKKHLYVGSAYSRSMSDRIKQHFRDKDSGGIRNKLDSKQIEKLQKSTIYFCEIDGDNRDVLFAEAKVIGETKPVFNFIQKQSQYE